MADYNEILSNKIPNKTLSNRTPNQPNIDDGYTLSQRIGKSAFLAISGYASVFNIVDGNNDFIISNAKILYERPLPILWQHSLKNPVGKVSKIYQNEVGLYIEGKMPLSVEKVVEIMTLLDNGILSGLSIGYKVLDGFEDFLDRFKSYPVFRIKELLIVEVSIVTIPANKFSRIDKYKVLSD